MTLHLLLAICVPLPWTDVDGRFHKDSIMINSLFEILQGKCIYVNIVKTISDTKPHSNSSRLRRKCGEFRNKWQMEN